jgi:hypothetical protein
MGWKLKSSLDFQPAAETTRFTWAGNCFPHWLAGNGFPARLEIGPGFPARLEIGPHFQPESARAGNGIASWKY